MRKPLLLSRRSGQFMNKFIAAYGTEFKGRVLPPVLTLMVFSSQVIGKNQSCRKAVDRINSDRVSAGLATGAVCDFAFGPYKGKDTGEHGLARQIIGTINPGDIILGDRYYDSYFFIAQVLQRGADLITRLHDAKNPDFRGGKYLGSGDHLVELVKPQKPK